jgi:mannose/cellobiose epimerase-like protein (N-acyl-D-glucosamine 2-epimerase family)
VATQRRDTAPPAIEVPRDLPAWRHWLGAEVMPFWAAKVAAEPIGYVEYLTPQGEPDAGSTRTPLVAARLVYSFSHAHVLGLGTDSLRAAEHGFRFLTDCCWDHAEGGFFHAVNESGEPQDRAKHAYDMAFVLLAMAWLHRASGRREPLDWARRTIDYLDAKLRDARRGGYRVFYRDDAPGDDPLPREINAQMHLLEAFHALHAATEDSAWLARADEMVALLSRHLIDSETGSLGELFTAEWQPALGAAGSLREPGNHFEVVWMLHNHARTTGQSSAIETAGRLYRFALAHGFEASPDHLPAAFARVTRDGRVLSDAKPLWAQTEVIKAALARVETFGDKAAARLARDHLALVFRHYLIDRNARWRNELARDGREIAAAMPIRVLYHLVLCFAEAMRLWPLLPAG